MSMISTLVGLVDAMPEHPGQLPLPSADYARLVGELKELQGRPDAADFGSVSLLTNKGAVLVVESND